MIINCQCQDKYVVTHVPNCASDASDYIECEFEREFEANIGLPTTLSPEEAPRSKRVDVRYA